MSSLNQVLAIVDQVATEGGSNAVRELLNNLDKAITKKLKTLVSKEEKEQLKAEKEQLKAAKAAEKEQLKAAKAAEKEQLKAAKAAEKAAKAAEKEQLKAAKAAEKEQLKAAKLNKRILSDTESDTDSPVQKNTPKRARAPKEEIDFEFFGDLDSLIWENLTLENEKSNKFWRIATKDNKVLINFGKQGAKGSSQQKTFETSEMAEDFLQKEIALKLKKGYVQ